ncbi:MAG TPA: PIN domain-containing protein [Anaerolineae bacterium]|nr:PIN domain-containing protein [Anaerolineae bacterium]
MKERIFVDASAWISIMYRRDKHHQEAKAIYQRLLDSDALLVVTNWAAYEALSFLKSRVGYEVALSLHEVLTDKELVWWESVTPEIESKAVDIFWRYKDKTWGIVDCASLIVMEITDCQYAFGFDRHFVEAAKQYGFILEGDDH